MTAVSDTSVTSPAWVVGAASPLCSSGRTLTVTDGVDSPDTTITVTPMSGYNAVVLSGLIEDNYSVWSLGVEDGDQFYSTFTTDANGNFSASDGTYVCYARKSATGLIESSVAIISDGSIGYSITGSLTRSSISKSNITR